MKHLKALLMSFAALCILLITAFDVSASEQVWN